MASWSFPVPHVGSALQHAGTWALWDLQHPGAAWQAQTLQARSTAWVSVPRVQRPRGPCQCTKLSSHLRATTLCQAGCTCLPQAKRSPGPQAGSLPSMQDRAGQAAGLSCPGGRCAQLFIFRLGKCYHQSGGPGQRQEWAGIRAVMF